MEFLLHHFESMISNCDNVLSLSFSLHPVSLMKACVSLLVQFRHCAVCSLCIGKELPMDEDAPASPESFEVQESPGSPALLEARSSPETPSFSSVDPIPETPSFSIFSPDCTESSPVTEVWVTPSPASTVWYDPDSD